VTDALGAEAALEDPAGAVEPVEPVELAFEHARRVTASAIARTGRPLSSFRNIPATMV